MKRFNYYLYYGGLLLLTFVLNCFNVFIFKSNLLGEAELKLVNGLIIYLTGILVHKVLISKISKKND